MNRIVAALRRTFGIVREHVGTDHLGNKYYSIPKQKTWSGMLCFILAIYIHVYVCTYIYTTPTYRVNYNACTLL